MWNELFAALKKLTQDGHFKWDRTSDTDRTVRLDVSFTLARHQEQFIIAVNGAPQHTKSSYSLAQLAAAQFIRINNERRDAALAKVDKGSKHAMEKVRKDFEF
jgi:N6-adenosine-specific RNA methylase IME4